MAHVPDDLRQYLGELDASGDLVHVRREVSTDRELSAVVKQLEGRGAPAVEFHTVRDSQLSVVAGLFGSRERIARAMRSRPELAVNDFLTAVTNPGSTVRTGSEAPVKDVRKLGADVDLGVLPISIHSAQDAGRFVTSGVTLVRDPVTGEANAGIYRMQVIDERHVTMNSSPALRAVIKQFADTSRFLEFVTVIGHHPALLVASQAQRNPQVGTLEIMGSLLGAPVATTRAEIVDLEVPSFSEIVLEGRLLPSERRNEGSFGEFTYYYDPGALVWTCEIVAITHRQDAIYLDIHPTHREHRCLWLFPGREAKLLAALRETFPAVRAIHLPEHGAGMTAYIAVDRGRESTTREVLQAALTIDPYLKHAYAVDPDVDVTDDQQVLWALNVRFQGDRDLIVLTEQPGARMDPSARRTSEGTLTSKLGFDATAKFEDPQPRADVVSDEYASLDLADYVEGWP